MSEIDQLGALAEYQGQFLETVGRADPELPVPWCGSWRVRNLVVHLARVHHWAAGQARRQQETPLGRGPFDLVPFYAECAAELRETLNDLEPDARAWTLLDDGVPRAEQTGTVRFWHRRQALETLVHLWDLRTAIGEDVEPGPAAWLDCLDEVVAVMHPRQVRLDRVAPPKIRLRFRPAETEAAFELIAAPDAHETVTISASARQLALLVWGRASLADQGFSVDGDRDGANAIVSAGLTP